MITYNYNRQFSPPAPLVHLSLFTPDDARRIELFPALIDHGADRTVLPVAAIEELGLLPTGDIPLMGLAGEVTRFPIFLVQLQIRGKSRILVEVAASQGEKLALLGRDVLNEYRIVMDGPRLKLEIE